MSNMIMKASAYVPMLDKIYQAASLTADLDGAPELARAGANANELIIPKLTMDGLAQYDRNGGYTGGDVSLVNETVICDYDRGRMFQVDDMDNKETVNQAFGQLSGEFIRTKVTPEHDAYRFAKYASKPGVSVMSGMLVDGQAAIAALREATNRQDEDEVNTESRYLYITPTLKGLIDDLDTTKSKAIFDRFAKVICVPQSRFYTAIDMLDGKTPGQERGGFRCAAPSYAPTYDESVVEGKTYYTADGFGNYTVGNPATNPMTEGFYEMISTGGKAINFMIVEKSAVYQFPKHVAPKIVDPAANQDADAWKFGYRLVSVAGVYDNKTAGIYVHHQA